MLKYYNSFSCNYFSMIVRPRERSDRAQSSAGSERSERDRTTYSGYRRDLCSAEWGSVERVNGKSPSNFMMPPKCPCANKEENRRAGRCHKNKRKNDKSRLWAEHHRSRAQGRACGRAVAEEPAKESAWDNISREQQHHPRDAPIKYNENYKTASEAQRMSYNTSLCWIGVRAAKLIKTRCRASERSERERPERTKWATLVKEEQEYYLGVSEANEQRSLQIHSFSVWLKQRALKTVYCRFSAALIWFLVAIRTPVLLHWQPALYHQRKVYIHRTECSYQSCEAEG